MSAAENHGLHGLHFFMVCSS